MNTITHAAFVDLYNVEISLAAPLDRATFAVYKSVVSDGADIGALELDERTSRVTVSVDEEVDLGCDYYAAVWTDGGKPDSVVKISFAALYMSKAFAKKYEYGGKLGAEVGKDSTVFRVWSPTAERVALNVYARGDGGAAPTVYKMKREKHGLWKATVKGDLDGEYYTYTVKRGDVASEVVDPYAVSVGRNGRRGMVLAGGTSDPDGWVGHSRPTPCASYSDRIIYEAHLRDLTIHESSNVPKAYRGKYLGMTVLPDDVGGARTPLSYIRDLGVTDIHFQPLYDFGSVDEIFSVASFVSGGENREYNWGYDPVNYNAPEGSYSTDPTDGRLRVKELKQMIMALHAEGVRVIFDVVYNHVFDAASSNFEALVPGYYFRTDESGAFCNGSGCGNETASERPMCRRFIIDSVCRLVREYKIDGLRFDLMGLHDVDTMNAVVAAVHEINPDVIVYGEPWTAGASGIADGAIPAVKANAHLMPEVAVFDDTVRDGLKGSVFISDDTGYASGKPDTEKYIYYGASGGTDAAAIEGLQPFAARPTQHINYASAHDNETLWDRLNGSVDADESVLKAMNRLAAVAVLTGQGPAFFLAGEEMLRTKPADPDADSRYGYNGDLAKYKRDGRHYSRNSYRSPDSVNAIDWSRADENADTVDFYKALIAIKKKLPQLRIADTDTLRNSLYVKQYTQKGVAAYAVGEDEFAVIAFNNSDKPCKVDVPDGYYTVLVDGAKADADGLKSFLGSRYELSPRSALVMTAALRADPVAEWARTPKAAEQNTLAPDGFKINPPRSALIADGKVHGIKLPS